MIFKKGELTTKQIVTLIILIVSFTVILILLFKLNLGEESDKEICHNSVVMRSSQAIPTTSVPLKCSRQYVCLTQDGSCERLLKPLEKKVKTKDEVYEVLANELADCWWMFGEGDLDYLGKEVAPSLYCSLCSQIAFDDSVKKIFNADTFDKKELYEYMATHKISSREDTYSEYLFNTNNVTYISRGQSFGDISLNKEYFALMGVDSDVSTVAWAGIGAAVVVVGAIAIGATGGLILLAAAGGGGGYFLAPMVQDVFGRNVIKPSLIEVNSQQYFDLNCENIVTLS